ncbi:MAG TPA: GNAT family N-acetyltransferase [Acidimicrobiales bacterium]|nr:GNAT family N-acetyltransferase [Acidimicrobiales bacterium]
MPGTRPTGAPASPPPAALAPVDVLLADGSTARVRPATPEDRAALVDFHARLSPESASSRYFGAHPRLSEADLARVTSGGPDDLALVAERDGRVVGLAEYHRVVGHEEAEVALVVDDAYQGRGLGTLLLEHLASEARLRGVRRFVADMLPSNARMRQVFDGAGFATVSSRSDGAVHVVLDIAPSQASIEATERRDREAVLRSMSRLLRPRSIAVIGASRRPGSIGHEIVRNLVAGGFQGAVYPVNPRAEAVASLPCWPSVTDVPARVDLAVIAVPAPAVLGVVGECGAKGVGALVVVSAGFAEVGSDGEAAQAALTRLAHGWGMRLVGPNCFGVVNTDPAVQMNATFAPERPLAGRVGFASQSGGLGIAILAEASARGLGISSFVSMGNKADVSGNDLLVWWDEDPATAVALLYLESFGNPRKFARLARRVGRRTPIVAVKAGRTRAGIAAASSHTAAMASSEQAVEALFRQSGVVRVDTVEELFDVASLLAHQPVPAGERVAIITNAGGPGVLAADACVRSGLSVPALSDELQALVRQAAPAAASVRNPIDLVASASADAFGRALELVLASGEADAAVVIFTPPLTTEAVDVAAAIAAAVDAAGARGIDRPVLATLFGTHAGRSILANARRPVPTFTYPETAVRALAHAVAYGRWRSLPARLPAVVAGTDANEARRRLAPAGPDGWLTGRRALAVLEAYEIPALATVEVASAEDAARAAEELGGTVVVKALGPGIIHKSDVGGVRLGVEGPAAARAAFESMARSIGSAMTGAVVQPQVHGGVEVIAGFVQDPQFGPVVLFGLGGVAVELLADHRVGLAPLSSEEAREMVLGVRGAPLLTGYRGSSPVDVDALVDLVLRVSRLAEDLPEVAEADCNPAIATPAGVVVVDARLRVASTPPAPPDDRRRLR